LISANWFVCLTDSQVLFAPVNGRGERYFTQAIYN